MYSAEEVTQALQAWSEGDRGAADEVMPVIYGELRRIAARYLSSERRDHTLEPKALVYESFLRLIRQERVEWQSRAHFYAISARMMRRVLLDHAKALGRAKRGGSRIKISLEDASPGTLQSALESTAVPAADLEGLDGALERLAVVDPAKATLIELRFFGGLSVAETADYLECSKATVARQWRMARAWLVREVMR